jgi:hypothetical protein
MPRVILSEWERKNKTGEKEICAEEFVAFTGMFFTTIDCKPKKPVDNTAQKNTSSTPKPS